MKKSKTLCSGCRDNFYNAHNRYGIKGCWHFSGAKVVKRTRVGTWQNPPYKWSPVETLSCHHPESGVWLDKKDPRFVAEEVGGE